MVLKLQAIKSNATLNEFHPIEVIEFVPGKPLDVVLRIIDEQLGDRRILDNTSLTLTLDLVDSSGANIAPAPTPALKFDPDDKSFIEFSLTAAQTTNLISQGMILMIDENGTESVAVAKAILQAVDIVGC